ncbi:MAG: tyrosine-protein phosphatase [Dysgonamonadaceae bacterium]|jgi:hypothetical protein|nr:tyrosine-protein phosphatase [Dysgonamonadaceae bacterium]
MHRTERTAGRLLEETLVRTLPQRGGKYRYPLRGKPHGLRNPAVVRRKRSARCQAAYVYAAALVLAALDVDEETIYEDYLLSNTFD